jgi:hypothetical protein
MDRQK